MNILYDVLQFIDVPALVEKCTDEWYNQTLCQVNESVVRLGILKGEYHWHKHDVEKLLTSAEAETLTTCHLKVTGEAILSKNYID